MLRVVGDQHHRHRGHPRIGLDRLKDRQAVAVIAVELAVDQHQVELLFGEQLQCVFRAVRLGDLGPELPLEHGADRPMIGDAVADVEHAFGHTKPATIAGG